MIDTKLEGEVWEIRFDAQRKPQEVVALRIKGSIALVPVIKLGGKDRRLLVYGGYLDICKSWKRTRKPDTNYLHQDIPMVPGIELAHWPSG